LIDTFQHWLLYDKLSSNNNINNYHHVNVIQVCVSKLTTCRALVLYNAYIVVLSVWTLMSILFSRLINSSLLCMLTSLRQWLFLLCSMITFCLYKTVSHHSRWELISCYTSMQFWFRVRTCWFLTVVLTVRNMIWHFLKCHHTSKHFNECCSNCKWCDHAAHCSVHNNDVLIVILNNENNNSADENECIVKSRWIALILLNKGGYYWPWPLDTYDFFSFFALSLV
jgi:hypothetical protein